MVKGSKKWQTEMQKFQCKAAEEEESGYVCNERKARRKLDKRGLGGARNGKYEHRKRNVKLPKKRKWEMYICKRLRCSKVESKKSRGNKTGKMWTQKTLCKSAKKRRLGKWESRCGDRECTIWDRGISKKQREEDGKTGG